MRTVEEHLERILATLEPAAPLELPLLDAQGCVLAADVVSSIDLPPWDNSAMDGYAVRLADVMGANDEFPAELDVVDDIAAGDVPQRAVTAGTASRIMTGAPMPEGAEAVVPVELTDAGTRRVAIRLQPGDGQHIRRRGSDVSGGETVLTAGVELGPAQLSIVAAIGQDRVLARPRPRVVILSTGSELVEPGLPLRPGAIYESNSFLLAAAVREAGGIPYRVGLVHDDEDLVLAAIEEQLGRADAVVTSGGVSAGAYDVVKAVLSKLGSVEFTGVRMNPGKPQGYGNIAGVPIFTLPGNPVSSYVSFEVFVRPALRRLRGLTPERRPLVRATLTQAMGSPAGKVQFARGRLTAGAIGWEVAPVGGPGSHLLGDLAAANCFVVFGEDVTSAAAGDAVDVMALGQELL
ncbi:MAG: molybdotransferase-like divisome protein Glp [Sporichthyaceae bacterium]